MLSNEFLAAAMAAPSDRLTQAFRILRGEESAPPQPVERFMTASEVARITGLSRTTLWRWNVPGYVLAGKPRYRISEVMAYLDSPAFQEVVAAGKANRWKKESTRKYPCKK
jgi:hypothetical protein